MKAIISVMFMAAAIPFVSCGDSQEAAQADTDAMEQAGEVAQDVRRTAAEVLNPFQGLTRAQLEEIDPANLTPEDLESYSQAMEALAMPAAPAPTAVTGGAVDALGHSVEAVKDLVEE